MGIFWPVFIAVQLPAVFGSSPAWRGRLQYLNMPFFKDKPSH
jgi:hypothetical protein